MNQADLRGLLETLEDEERVHLLEVLLRGSNQTFQINQGQAKGYQVRVEGGIAYIGDINVDSDLLEEVLRRMSQQPQLEISDLKSKLLSKVKTEVTKALLDQHVWIYSPKTQNPRQVTSPLAEVKPIEDRASSEEDLPRDTSIFDQFTIPNIGRKILILGSAGCGKTSELLKLADSILKEAESNCTLPIPILLNLSTWRNEQSIHDWIISELEDKYSLNITKIKDQERFCAEEICFLIDGLDAVKQEYQKRCVRQINDWLDWVSPLHVAISCRTEVYERNIGIRLYLSSAICLKPWEEFHIKEYFKNFDLGIHANQNGCLHALLSIPLFSSVFREFLCEKSIDRLNEFGDWKESLLNEYVKRQFSRGLVSNKKAGKSVLSHTFRNSYLPRKIRMQFWLIVLSKYLSRNKLTEFSVESIQPQILKEFDDLNNLRTFSISVWTIYYWLVVLFSMLLMILPYFAISWVTGGVNFGLLISFILITFTSAQDLVVSRIRFPIVIGWSIRRSVKSYINTVQSLLLNYQYIMFLFLIVFVLYQYPSYRYMFISCMLLVLLFISFCSGLILGDRINVKNISSEILLNRVGLKKSLFHFLMIFTVVSVFGFMIYLFMGDDSYRIVLLVILYFLFFVLGGGSYVKYLFLRLVAYGIGNTPWNYSKNLDYLVERKLMQRIGDNYMFLHPDLKEWFASKISEN
jgi:NACHT domain